MLAPLLQSLQQLQSGQASTQPTHLMTAWTLNWHWLGHQGHTVDSCTRFRWRRQYHKGGIRTSEAVDSWAPN
jgi:hypothetical protein